LIKHVSKRSVSKTCRHQTIWELAFNFQNQIFSHEEMHEIRLIKKEKSLTTVIARYSSLVPPDLKKIKLSANSNVRTQEIQGNSGPPWRLKIQRRNG